MLTCGEVLVNILTAYGVDTVFGIPGVHTVELYRGLPNTPIRHITPRHEQGAGFMADGYARVTGNPGVCFIITGPGMTNIATAMGQARADSIPMLVISSVNQAHQLGMGEGRLHELPSQRNLVSGVSVFSHTLLRPDELPKVLARAFAIFSSERPGPVHIEIPTDVITLAADHLDQSAWPLPAPPAPAPEQISIAAAWLRAAQRPLLAIGGGAIAAGDAIITLAEKLNAPVINTVNAKGVIPASHPLAVGGSSSCQAVRDELKHADVVLGVGTEFGETDYDYFYVGEVGIKGKLIRIDIDTAQLSRNVKPNLAIRSDARYALQALLCELHDLPTKETGGVARATALRNSVRQERNPDFAAFFATIQEALPGVIIAGDSTQPTYYAWMQYETEQARRYFHSASGFGTLGYAVPSAIGAKLAAPERPVVGLIGDGAIQFTIGELASAVEARTAVIFLIWNNQGYGEIKRFMQEGNIPEIGVDIHTPDFLAIAKGFGCQASRATTLEELKVQLQQANNGTQPAVIEVRQDDFLNR